MDKTTKAMKESYKNDVISVIIPVYNVELYLIKCLESVINQTYDNLNILVVNDGSTDGSSIICDAYAKKDNRIKVIHKDNGGLSDARNVGIQNATGEYITFIDSDDYVDKDYLEFLHDNITATSSDIATCKFARFYSNSNVAENTNNDQRFNISGAEALIEALYGSNTSLHACCKLYRMNLFNSIRFPVGKYFEDTGTTYKLFSISTKVDISTSAKYHYLTRVDSITGSKFSHKDLDLLAFAKEIFVYTEKYQPKAVAAATYFYFIVAVDLIYKAIAAKEYTASASSVSECKEVIKNYHGVVSKNSRVNFLGRLYAYAATNGINNLICLLFMRKIAKNLKSIYAKIFDDR